MGSNPIDGYIRDFQHRWTITVVLFFILFYYIHDIYKIIHKNHGETMVINPYAARPPTIVDSGLTNSNVLTWGNDIGGETCPNMSQAKQYLAMKGMDYYSDMDYEKQNFLGHAEPPVFYDIGDVRKTRDTRAGNQSNVGISAAGDNAPQVSYIPDLDADGVQKRDVNGMPLWKICPTGFINVGDTCQPKPVVAETMHGNWMTPNPMSKLNEGYTSDFDLISRSY